MVIGDIVRLSNWKDCVVKVKDVGQVSFWGVLYDVKENMIINEEYVGFFDDDWINSSIIPISLN